MRKIALHNLTFNEKDDIILQFNIEYYIVKRKTENVLNYNN